MFKIYLILSVIGIGAVIGVFFYRRYLLRNYKDEINSLYTALISAIIAVLFGVGTAIFIVSYQNNINDTTRQNQLKSLVKLELNNNIVLLRNKQFTIKIGTTKWAFRSTYLEHQVIDSAALSGLFTGLQSNNLLALSANIRFYNAIVKDISSIYFINLTENQLSIAKHLHDNQVRVFSKMEPHIQKCARELGVTLY